MKRLLALAWCGWVCASVGLGADDDLAHGFMNPPEAAHPWVYWFVMDGNLRREGITADFEALQRVGIRGVLFMEVDVGIPKGPVKFMSPPWRELFKHANAEAARLGLVMTMPASPGWTGSGGPWVKPEQSMQKLVSSELSLTGPQRFEGALPQPETVAGFYRDVAVLAFPTPAQPYRIPDIAEKALYHRGHFSSEPGVKPLLIPADHEPTLAPAQVIARRAITNLTARLGPNGRLTWDVPDGRWTVIRFGHTSTGANTRPAPQPGLGLECDKLDKAALEAHFESFLGKLMEDLGPLTGKSLVSLHIDSWEMGPQNWTAGFAQEFQQRRGYDVLPWLPVMTGRVVDDLGLSERFLWDLRQTVLELISDNHARHLADLAHRHGLGLSIEPYDGTPCDDMTYGSRADVPMGEFWRDTFNTWFSCTEATSIAHTYGQRIIQAEAFTSGDGERWLAHPATLKTLGDWAFCEGINRLVFHRYAHQPWLDRFPGMTMGPYGIHYERTQTWFDLSAAWIQYLTRCQFLLQQGLPVADVCFLKPEASPQVFRPPASATRGTPPDRLGHSFDAITPEALLTRASVKDGLLTLPDGVAYRVLVLPEVPTMTPRLLEKIDQLVQAGATVLGPPPARSPSLSGYPECDQQIQQLRHQLWGPCDGLSIKEHRHGLGRVVWERDPRRQTPPPTDPLERAKWIWHREGNPATAAPEIYPDFALVSRLLEEMNVPPDFQSDGPFRYTHRRTATDDIYFVANREPQTVAAYCTFRVTGKTPEIWDPLTGKRQAAAVFEETRQGTRLPLWLEPEGSRFVLFRRAESTRSGADGARVTDVTRNGESLLPSPGRPRLDPPPLELYRGPDGKLAVLAWEPGRYALWPSGHSAAEIGIQVDALPPVQEITGPWTVRFDPKRGAPDRIVLDQLTDWSKHPDPGVRFFSGTATYEKAFHIPSGALGEGKRLYLDLGRVQVMAQVRLNGTGLGVLWKTPFRVEITEAVRPGENKLEVTVANLWPNRLIGDQGLPPEQRLAWTTWNPFTKDSPLLESGWLGPVTVRVAQTQVVSLPSR